MDFLVFTGPLLCACGAQLRWDLIQHEFKSSKVSGNRKNKKNPLNIESVLEQEKQQNVLDTLHIQGIFLFFQHYVLRGGV